MLLDLISKKHDIKGLVELFAKPGQIVHGLTNSAKSFMLANLLEQSSVPIIFFVQNHFESEIYQREINNLSSKPVFNFACQEISPYDQINSDSTVLANQYEIFEHWQTAKPSLTILPFKALLQLYISKSSFESRSFTIKKSQELEPLALAKRLETLGYSHSTMVETRAQYSHRGDIFDIYPLLGEAIRIEFFGDNVESIRSFSIYSQRSIKELESARIHPRYLLERSENDGFLEKLEAHFANAAKSLKEEAQESFAAFAEAELANANESLYWEGIEYYREFFEQASSSLSEFLPERAHVIFDEWEDLNNFAARWQGQLEEQYAEGVVLGKLLPLTKPLYYDFNTAVKELNAYPQKLYLQAMPESADSSEILSTEITCYPAERFSSKVEELVEFIRAKLREEEQILIFSEQPQRVLGILKEWDIAASYELDVIAETVKKTGGSKLVWVQRDGTEEGFKLVDLKLIVLTDRELFGRSRQAIAKQKTRRPGAEGLKNTYTDISQLKSGDYVVHYKHGIGLYRGTEFIEIGTGSNQIRQEYIAVEYADEARILIPVDQVHLLSRLQLAADTKARLSKLGGTEWQRTKKKVKKSVQRVAQDLLNLYAMRSKQTGYKYPPDTPWQLELEDSFSYTETDDQLKAITAIKADMESDKLMDRLICGDAGFGKTEVVLRAVFKVIMEGRQVAILVPTTVLAQQHYNVFQDRFAAYPARVGLLCRFKTPREQKETIEKLKLGECDVVIGTHRLLQKDIRFKNLGLLVIDEEQRFGVAHKEKLKSYRADVEIITMSATPIPRTLHMSLTGTKDISLIKTPPVNRLPVKTFVGEYKTSVVRNAILHELERGGQIFFVHNRVETIESVAANLKDLVPEANVRYAHGQMSDKDLEDVMFSFVNREFDLIVCTTIIETGLDIASANTIILDSANMFGLSQLYQLRGRVGRSDLQAYAYFLYQPEKEMSDTARKRLKAIREFTNLGSGYQLALRDMEIRGVGNVLGLEQHGHMIAVGFDLYCKMLNDSMEELRGNLDPKELEEDLTVDVKINAYFPSDWIVEEKQRINEYRRLAELRKETELESLVSEWEDRFGRIPEPTQNLLELVRLKMLARVSGVGGIKEEPDGIKISIDIRLQTWLPMQRRLPTFLQTKAIFKPGALGSRHSQPYIFLYCVGMDTETKLDALRQVITVLGSDANKYKLL